MIPSHAAEQSAVALQLVEALDRYEADLAALVEGRWDPDLFESLTAQFDSMRVYAAVLPRLGIAWVELLISRFELVDEFWRRQAARSPGDVQGKYGRHRAIVKELRRGCGRYIRTG